MKKMISAFLALCMVATLLPTAFFAAGADTGNPIVADFTKTSKGNNLSFDAVVTDGFSIVEEKSSTKGLAAAWNGVGLQFNTYQYAGNLTTWPADKSAKNQMFTVNVVAEKSGYYDPEFIYEAFYKGANFAIYINGQYAGVVDSYDETAGETGVVHTAKLNSVFLDEGANEVSFRCVSKTKTGGSWLILNKLTLTPCEETPVPAAFSHNLPEIMCKGESVDFAVQAKMSDGSIRYFGKYEDDGKVIADMPISLSVTSGNGEITNLARVPDGTSASFSAQTGGTATIKASVNIDGNTFEDSFNVEVLDEELATTSLVVPASVFKGDVIELKTVDTLTNGEEWDIPNSCTVFTSSNPEVAKIEGDVLTALEKGKTTVTAETTFAGVTKKSEVEVTVSLIPLGSVSLSLDKDSVPATRTVSANISVLNDRNDEFTEEYDISCESLNTDVATVAVGEDKKTAKITGVSKGTATIRVTVTSDGVTKTAEKDIVVSNAPIVEKLVLTTDKNSYSIGDEGTFTLSVMMSDGLAATEEELSRINLTYENDNESVIALNTEEKKFTALSQGDAEISAIADVGGEKFYGRRVVKVVAEGSPIVANFSVTALGEGNKYEGARTVGFTIDEDKSSGRGAMVAQDGLGLQINCFVSPVSASIAWPESKSKDLMFTVNIESEKEGYYTPELTYEAYEKSGEYAIYINGRFAGEINAYDAKYSKGDVRTARLNTVYLKTGINEVSFRCIKHWRVKNSSWLILDKLALTPCGDTLLPVGFSHNIPEAICKGQAVDFTVQAKMSDGSTKLFGTYDNDGNKIADAPMSLSVTSGNGEITNTTQTLAGVNGTFSAQAGGTATIKASVNIDGNTFEESFDVEVLDEELKTTRPEISGTVFKDDVIELKTVNTLTNGESLDIPVSYTVFTSSDSETAKIEGNVLTALKAGTVTVTAKTTLAGVTKEGSIDITILDEDVRTIELTAGGSLHLRLTGIEGDTVPMYLKGITNKGAEVEITRENAEITYEALTPEIATIDEEGNITPLAAGDAKFRATVLFRGRTIVSEATFASAKAKTHSTYYTDEKKANVLENISKYSWAKSEAEAAVKNADKYVDKLDILYNLITSNEIPRAFAAGEYGDPEAYNCRYCGCDILNTYGRYAWTFNAISRPWKVQCPDCKRLFPSNDFGSFYELGLNEYGEFSRERALLRHHKKFVCKDGENCKCKAPAMSEQTNSDGTLNKEFYTFYGYGKEGGYLCNKLYPEVGEVKTVNCGRGIMEENGEDASFWGVDDGLGYLTGYKYTDAKGNVLAHERHNYIALYTHYGVFRKGDTSGGAVILALQNCFQAYLFTGDKKYGRVAAILVDRIADFYPGYDLSVFYKNGRILANSDGGNRNGKIVGNIWETGVAKTLCEAYDAVYEMYDDPEVLRYIQNKGKVLKFRHAKNTPSQIRTSIEDGILRTSFKGLSDGSIAGNFGHDQRLNAIAAVILDSQPETKEWLEFLMAPGWKRMQAGSTGGSVIEVLYNQIDWDGQGDEGSGYNSGWLSYLLDSALILADYENSGDFDFFKDPKFVKMFYGMLNTTMTDYSVQVGDSDPFTAKTFWLTSRAAMAAYKYIGDEVFLQALYTINGYSSSGIHEDIYTKNPEQIKEDMERIIRQKGTLSLDSEMLSGFGLSALRDGKRYSKEDDTRHGFWMFYGLTGSGHGHRDTLNLGMDAFGLNFMPDFGYPTTADSQPRVLQWEVSTLSHNTVMVNERRQTISKQRGKSLHFDSTENVQLMDVDAPDVCSDSNVSVYRRSVIMIKIDEDNFYGLDLFRVKGGWSHELSLHAQSDEIGFSSGVDFAPQVDSNGNYVGSYASPDWPYGPDPNSPIQATYETVYPRGYTWLENVDRGTPSSDKVELDFNIKDFTKTLKNPRGLHLRATMLGIDPDWEVNTATGYVPKTVSNAAVPGIRFAFVKHKSEDKSTPLDTLFTTVYEPYRDTRTLSDISELTMTASSGREDPSDIARCIKVVHADGERVDYIFYATNNKVTYTVADGDKSFTFRGFAGVITLKNGVDIYKYICDGDILDGSVMPKKAINARVTSFTETPEFENEIHIKPLSEVDAGEISSLAGRYVYVENGNVRNAAYKIESAKANGDEIILNIGNATLVTSLIDPYAGNKAGNYNYNIAKRADCVIPLSWSENYPPSISKITDKTVTAGSSLSFTMRGESPIDGAKVSLALRSAPRGASLNTETGEFNWKPDSSQVGDHVVTVVVKDEYGRESASSFKITVYGATTQGGSGGAGGGGGGTPAPTPDPEPTPTPDPEPTPEPTPGEDEGGFIDIDNYAWAKDSINALAKDGVIKGTSENTFSPGDNITRADFAILLVRAFKLTGEGKENFADVDAGDYFAHELAIAKENGIVGGIGDNKYAPRNTITREDMMVIVYRALTALGMIDETNAERNDTKVVPYEDFGSVADYAKDAVSYLIANGLVNGKNGLIDPKAYTTRAEVAVLVKRILEYTK